MNISSWNIIAFFVGVAIYQISKLVCIIIKERFIEKIFDLQDLISTYTTEIEKVTKKLNETEKLALEVKKFLSTNTSGFYWFELYEIMYYKLEDIEELLNLEYSPDYDIIKAIKDIVEE